MHEFWKWEVNYCDWMIDLERDQVLRRITFCQHPLERCNETWLDWWAGTKLSVALLSWADWSLDRDISARMSLSQSLTKWSTYFGERGKQLNSSHTNGSRVENMSPFLGEDFGRYAPSFPLKRHRQSSITLTLVRPSFASICNINVNSTIKNGINFQT